MAEAANSILDSLYNSKLEGPIVAYKTEESSVHVQFHKPITEDYLDDEEEALLEVYIWMEDQGLDPGELGYELMDDTDDLVATIDLAWPDGIQTGLTEPVALLLNEPPEVCQEVSHAGFIYFTDVDAFKEHVQSKHLALV